MGQLSVEKIKYYYDKAQKAKEGITAKYNDVLNYTNVSYTISETKSENKETREIEEVVSESKTTLVNFIMSNVFPRGLRWATLEINETLYNQGSGDQGTVSNEDKIKTINKELEKMADTFFDFLNNSNFYTEASKAVSDASVLGTGVVKIIENDDPQKPFIYKYQNLDGFYFLENMLGMTNICFKSIFEVTKEDITELYGEQASIPEKAQEEMILKQEIKSKLVDMCKKQLKDQSLNYSQNTYEYANYYGEKVFGAFAIIPTARWCAITERKEKN